MRVQPSTGSLETSGTITASSFIGTATHATNVFYIKTQYQENTNFYTGYRAWFKWIDGSTLGLKIAKNNTETDTTISTYKFKADLAYSADKVNVTAVSLTEVFYIPFVDALSGSREVSVNSNLWYNPGTNTITATTFNGNATSASKLSTVSKTAWGKTYWTADGVPTDISGDITGTYFVIKDVALAPYLKLTTSNSKTAVFYLSSAGNILIGPTTSKALQISAAGAVTLPSTLTVTSNITSSGTISATGGVFETSDARLKYFIKDIEVDFSKLKEIPKKYFIWKNDKQEAVHIGTSAQNLKNIYPELV
jgi:hypothetical protein